MRRRLTRPALALLVAGALAASGAAAAAAPSPPTAPRSEFAGFGFRISGNLAIEDESGPAVAYNLAADEYLVVRADYRDFAGRGADIYGRRVDGDGTGLVGDLRLNGDAAVGADLSPDVAYDGDHQRYLVVWQDHRNEATSGSDIYGRLIAGDGTRLGRDFRISAANATEDEANPQVAYHAGMTEFLVVWQDGRNAGSRGTDVFGQVVDADGTKIGHNFRISGPAAVANEIGPAVAPFGMGFLVVWPDERCCADEEYLSFYGDVYGRFVSTAGACTGPDFRVNAAGTAAGWSAAVATNQSNNQFLVVWMGFEGGGIFGQRLDFNGSALGGTFLISENDWDSQFDPAVAESGGEFLVAWHAPGNYIEGRRVSTAGVPLGGGFDVGGAATAAERAPDLAFGYPAFTYLVVWEDYRRLATRGVDIFGRMVNG